jgi:hypothetical protein
VSDGSLYYVALAWPELPGRPLAVGVKWKMHKTTKADSEPVETEVDAEVTAIDKDAVGPVAVIRIGATLPHAYATVSLEGRVRVRADAPEWLGAELEVRAHTPDRGRGEADSVSHVTLKLTPRPDLHYAVLLEKYLRP